MDKSTRKTLLKQWLSPINQTSFEEQMNTHQLDHNTKKLHIYSFMSLLLYAQLHETKSLQALNDAVFSDDLQQTVGLDSISFSQLGRRLNKVPTDFFQSIFLALVSQVHEKIQFQTRRKMTTPLKIIDLSTLPLNLTHHKWAEFRKTKSGVKLHLRLVFMEKRFSYPDKAVITNAIEHDRGQLEVLVDDKACMHLLNRGERYFKILRLQMQS